MLTVERLKEVLHYDPETGVLTWLAQLSPRGVVGAVAGSTTSKGYRDISIDRGRYKAHRLAYLYMTGEWPPHEIDHRDGDPSNNRWKNIRAATRSENMQNKRKAQRNNECGFLGVSKSGSRYRAQIGADGKLHRLGTCDTPEAAHALHLEAKVRLHPFQEIVK